jgi:hypothetical protein
MAFSSTLSGKTVFGNKRVTWGSYNGAGVTTGDLDTGLSVCENLQLTGAGSSVVADAPTVNETLPVAGSAVTLIFTSGTTGYWYAIGS